MPHPPHPDSPVPPDPPDPDASRSNSSRPQSTRTQDGPRPAMQGQTFYLDHPLVTGRVWDMFTPHDQNIQAAMFFIHGGGWRVGTRTIFHPMIDALLDHAVASATTDYRLSNATIAEQLTDIREVYARFLQRLEAMGKTIKPIVFGSSAGGHLALLMALAKPGACGEQLPTDVSLQPYIDVKPAGVAVVSAPVTLEPWDEMLPESWNAIQRLIGVSYEDDPKPYRLGSPMTHVNDDAPPVLLMQAGDEHMFPNRLADPFIQAMKNCGAQASAIEYSHAEHGFFYDVTRPCQQRAMRDLLSFIKQCNVGVADDGD